MNNTALNNRLAVLGGYFAQVDAEIATQVRVLDTYEGMLSMCNDGEGSDSILDGMARVEAELAQLRADRAELDGMWNAALLAAEAA